MKTSLNPHKNPMGFAVGMVVAMFTMVCIFMYFLFIKEPYLSYRNLPFPPLLEKVAEGQIIPIRVERCNSDKVPHTYTTSRSLESVDHDERGEPQRYYTLQSEIVSISPGCVTGISLANRLPEHVVPGQYRLIGTADVNTAFRTHHITWQSQPFEVVHAKK